jgi:hypothetical protein
MSDVATLWGIGRYDGPDGPVSFELGHDEVQRDLGSAMRRLGRLGLGDGKRVLFCSMLSEAGQFWPWILGAMLNGSQLSCADASEGEARRVATYCRLLDYDAVLGLTGALLDGIDQLGLTYEEVFGRVGLVGARPEAAARLRADGAVQPTAMALVGPAIALADGPGEAATVDTDEWEIGVEEGSGRLWVTALRPRATPFVQAPSAIRGRISAQGELRFEGEP